MVRRQTCSYSPWAGGPKKEQGWPVNASQRRKHARKKQKKTMPEPPRVTLYTSTTPSSAKQRTECSRLKQLLDAKKVVHIEVREGCERVSHLFFFFFLPSRLRFFFTPLPTLAQVDLASEDSTARLAMLAGSDGVDTIPQLHVNGKVREATGKGKRHGRRRAARPFRRARCPPSPNKNTTTTAGRRLPDRPGNGRLWRAGRRAQLQVKG